jgi:DNA-binding XRE family transcriptional regulator
MNLLTEYRIKNGLSVINFAKIIGVSRTHVYELESGTTPSVKLAKKIKAKTNGELNALELLGLK